MPTILHRFLFWSLLCQIQFCHHSAKSCNSELRNVQEKYERSSIVIVAQFINLTLNQTDPRVMLVANFKVEHILKNENEEEMEENLRLPLYRGHSTFSKRMWCMNDRMFREDKKYVLFLDYAILEQTGERKWRNTFVPVGWNRRIKMDIQTESNSDSLVLPVFEVELDLDSDSSNTGQPVKKAEVDPSDGVHLRCTVKGVAADEPELGWIYDGHPLATNADGIEVETDKRRLVSNLKLGTKHAAKGGTYECTAKRKEDGKFHKTKLKIVPRIASSNETLFGAVFCGPEREGWCQHGGTCLYQPSTRIYSCRCRSDSFGPRCEYFRPPHTGGITQQQYDTSMALMGGTACLLIVSLILVFLLYIKKRDQIKSKFSRLSTKKNENVESLIEHGSKSGGGDEERLLDRIPTAAYSRDRRDLIAERLHIIQSLIPARCPHCRRKLGINGNSLNMERGHNDTKSSAKGKTSEEIENSQCRDCAAMHRNQSIPEKLEVNIEMHERREKRRRRDGVSDDSVDSSIGSDRKSVSSPVTPSVSLCQLHSGQQRQRATTAAIEIEKAPR